MAPMNETLVDDFKKLDDVAVQLLAGITPLVMTQNSTRNICAKRPSQGWWGF